MRWLALALLILLACGCGGRHEDPPAANQPPASPEDALYQQLRAGAFQLGAAQDSLAEALRAVQDLNVGPAARQAQQDAEALLDSAGASLGDFLEPPARGKIAEEFAAHDEMRVKAIEAANDALHETREAAGILRSLADEGVDGAAQAAELADLAANDLQSAIDALGGQVEDPAPEADAAG